MTRNRVYLILAITVTVGACTTTAPRRDHARIEAAVGAAALGSPHLPIAGDSTVALKTPLMAADAVQVALSNNPQVRLQLSRVDVAQADRIQAGLLANPMASLMAMRPSGGGRYQLDYGLMQSLYDLFTRSRRSALADAGQQQAEADVIGQLATLAQDTEAAYYDALAGGIALRLQREQLALAREALRWSERQAEQGGLPASTVLSRRAEVSRLEQMSRAAEVESNQARGQLALLMGLGSAKGLAFPDALPALTLPGLDEATFPGWFHAINSFFLSSRYAAL